MKDTFIAVSGLLLQIVVGFAPIFLFKAAVVSKSALGRLAGKLDAGTKGLTNKAKEFGENRNFYQRRQFAKDARKQEQRRAHVEDYAAMASGDSRRSRLLRRRAAGGTLGQVFNTNQTGQQRVLQAAQDTLRKQRHEEATRAAQRMTAQGIEGDADLVQIANMATGGEWHQTREDAQGREIRTGVSMRVTEAERQAAINSLVQQGRVSPLRSLENSGPARGPGGVPNEQNPLHHMLDEAYTSVPHKLGDKAPDLVPNRRATGGTAAFTDLQPNDVAGWHQSTVSAAERYYDSQGAPGNLARDQTLRAFAEATSTPSTLASLSPEQVTNFRNMMERHIAAGHTVDPTVRTRINEAYVRKGGNASDPVPAGPPPPPNPPPAP